MWGVYHTYKLACDRIHVKNCLHCIRDEFFINCLQIERFHMLFELVVDNVTEKSMSFVHDNEVGTVQKVHSDLFHSFLQLVFFDDG